MFVDLDKCIVNLVIHTGYNKSGVKHEMSDNCLLEYFFGVIMHRVVLASGTAL